MFFCLVFFCHLMTNVRTMKTVEKAETESLGTKKNLRRTANQKKYERKSFR